MCLISCNILATTQYSRSFGVGAFKRSGACSCSASNRACQETRSFCTLKKNSDQSVGQTTNVCVHSSNYERTRRGSSGMTSWDDFVQKYTDESSVQRNKNNEESAYVPKGRLIKQRSYSDSVYLSHVGAIMYEEFSSGMNDAVYTSDLPDSRRKSVQLTRSGSAESSMTDSTSACTCPYCPSVIKSRPIDLLRNQPWFHESDLATVKCFCTQFIDTSNCLNEQVYYKSNFLYRLNMTVRDIYLDIDWNEESNNEGIMGDEHKAFYNICFNDCRLDVLKRGYLKSKGGRIIKNIIRSSSHEGLLDEKVVENGFCLVMESCIKHEIILTLGYLHVLGYFSLISTYLQRIITVMLNHCHIAHAVDLLAVFCCTSDNIIPVSEYVTILDLVNDNLSTLSPKLLHKVCCSLSIQGFRLKTYLDNAIDFLSPNIEMYNWNEVSALLPTAVLYDGNGLARSVLRTISANAHKIKDDEELIMCLTLTRQLSSYATSRKLQSTVCEILLTKVRSMSEIALCKCLAQLEYDNRLSPSVRPLVHVGMHRMNKLTMKQLALLSLEEIVKVLISFTSWGFRTILYNKMGDYLVTLSERLRLPENTENWMAVLTSYTKAQWYHPGFINVVFSIVRNSGTLKELNCFQVGRLAGCLARLHHYEPDIYRALAKRLYEDFSYFCSVKDISPIVWVFANANYIYAPLFDRAYDAVMKLIKSETLDLTKLATVNSLISLCWSFVVAQYHLRPDFAALADYAYFNRDPMYKMGFKRLHQIADACWFEAPHVIERCQYGSTMLRFCDHPNCRAWRGCNGTSNFDKDAEMLRTRTINEISASLKKMGIMATLHIEPDVFSPYLIDVCFDNKRKCGFFVQGTDKLMRSGYYGRWVYDNTGIGVLQRRMLAKRGWTLSTINLSDWLNAQNHTKEEMLKNKFKECWSHLYWGEKSPAPGLNVLENLESSHFNGGTTISTPHFEIGESDNSFTEKTTNKLQSRYSDCSDTIF